MKKLTCTLLVSALLFFLAVPALAAALTHPSWCPAEEYAVFEYHVVPCYNLYQQLLWHRERLEVLEPASVREEMAKVVKSLAKMYE